MARLTPIQFEELQNLLVDAFGVESLNQLVRLRMGVDMYKEYVAPGQPFRNAVFALIAALEERGTTVSLIDAVVKARPDKAEIQLALPPMRMALATPASDAAQQVGQVQIALVAAGTDAARHCVPPGSAALVQKLYADLELIQSYKFLHDCLHKAQLQLSPLEIEARAMGQAGAEDAAERFDASLSVFVTEAILARQCAGKLPAEPSFLREPELGWLTRFDEALGLAKRGMETGEAAPCRLAASRFRSILRREPSRIDGILRSCAGSLDLDGLRKILAELEVATATDPAVSTAFGSGRQAAEFLFRQLKALVNQHNQWQNMDMALWELEDQLPAGAGEVGGDFELLWADLSQALALLVATEPQAPWAIGVMELKIRTDHAWEVGPGKDLARAFKQFRKSCGMNFFQVDSSLKGLADEVARLRESLNQLLIKLAS